ncbi:MAG: ankyrin repeat domain-containing protein [Treponema sp.]|nr:ankyrin repeat domain-containing protein [Treponema sp.]
MKKLCALSVLLCFAIGAVFANHHAEELVRAAQTRNLHALENAIRIAPNINHQSPTTGRTALIEAAAADWDAGVRMLMGRGAAPNITDHTGMSALMHAVGRTENVALVRFMIESGANPNQWDNTHRTVLMHAARNQSDAIFGFILNTTGVAANINRIDNSRQNTLIIAASVGNYNAVAQLLAPGLPTRTNVGQVDNMGRTAFVHAAFEGHLDIVRLFLSRPGIGTDVLRTDISGVPVLLHLIQFRVSDSVIETIVTRHPETLRQADGRGRNAMDYLNQFQRNNTNLRSLFNFHGAVASGNGW